MNTITKTRVHENMSIISIKAHQALLRKGVDRNRYLRIIVKSGGCAGMTYDAEIDEKMYKGEKVVAIEDGITIVTDQQSYPYVIGLELDYSDDLISAGFRFSNSSNETSCGCGASFNVAGFPIIDKEGVTCGS